MIEVPWDERAWIRRYLSAAHIARVAVAGFALFVAAETTDEIPVAGSLSIALAGAGLAWTLVTALAARPLGRRLGRRPRLILVDSAVLTALALADKPWDAMVAVPYLSFLLLVVYARPVVLAVITVVVAVLQYVPRLLLEAIDWRYAELCPPVTTADRLTAYVGPLFAGTICWALCILVTGVRRATADWQRAQASAAEAELRRANARARLALADRLHGTISQTLRAIPLRLDGPPPADASCEALGARSQIIERALALRPAVQQIARRLRFGEDR